MISLPVINQAPQGYEEHDPFRHRHGHPYPGDSKEPRQQQDTAAEQAEGPEEGQDGGYKVTAIETILSGNVASSSSDPSNPDSSAES